MPDEKLEDETYSLIFASLRHPIRRKILRMLVVKPSTFSGILESLSIDSGHLSYHIESLGELLTRSEDGVYRLSSVGVAAVRLMSGVEEYPPAQGVRSVKSVWLRPSVMRIYSAVIVVVLIVLTFCSLVFTVSHARELPEFPRTEIAVPPSETFRFNVIIVYKQGVEVFSLRDNSITDTRGAPINTVNAWETGFFWFDLESSEAYNLTAVLHSPDGTVLSSRNLTNQGPGLYRVSLGLNEIATAGSYWLAVKNNRGVEMHGTLMAHIVWQRFDRPLFYVGVISLIILLLYPVLMLMLVRLVRRRKLSPKS